MVQKNEDFCDFSDSDDVSPNMNQKINQSEKAKLRKIEVAKNNNQASNESSEMDSNVDSGDFKEDISEQNGYPLSQQLLRHD